MWFCFPVGILLLYSILRMAGRVMGINIEMVSPGLQGNSSASTITLTGPAFDVSIERLHRRYPNFNISHRYLYDELILDCETLQREVQNILARWFYRERKVDGLPVIITPGCVESAQINQLAAAWNVLFISTANSDPALYDKQLSPSWITTNLYPSTYYGDIFGQLLELYNWSFVEILLDRDATGFYVLAARKTAAALEKTGIRWIMLFLGSPVQLRELLISAYSLNLTSGDYVYIATEPFPWQGYGAFNWSMGDEHDEAVHSAYDSVILVKMIDLEMNSPPNLTSMMAQWKSRYLRNPFYHNTHLETEPPLPQLTSTTAALEIFGQVLNDTISNSPDFTLDTEGTVLAGKMAGHSFNTSVGLVTFDRNGERKPLMVTASFFNQSSGKFTTFLQSDIEGTTFRWSSVRTIMWHNGSDLPPSQPICGFQELSHTCNTARDSNIWPLVVLVPLAILLPSLAAYVSFRKRTKLNPWWELDNTWSTMVTSAGFPTLPVQRRKSFVAIRYSALMIKAVR